MRYYKGWSITYGASRPVTGLWRASRFGVEMCAGSKDALLSMIDKKHLYG